MDQMVCNDIACNAYRSLGLLFGTHTFHFNCFFEDFNCVFTQIRCLSRVLIRVSNGLDPVLDQHSVDLIWVQTVRKGYLQTTKVPASEERIKSELCAGLIRLLCTQAFSQECVPKK